MAVRSPITIWLWLVDNNLTPLSIRTLEPIFNNDCPCARISISFLNWVLLPIVSEEFLPIKRFGMLSQVKLLPIIIFLFEYIYLFF